MEKRKKGKMVQSEARNMAKRIIQKCDEEARQSKLNYCLRQATLRSCDYTGLSKSTVFRIKNETFESGEEPLSSPGKKRVNRTSRKFQCTEEYKAIIRRIIHEFYTEKKVVLTSSKLLMAIREKIYFPWQVRTLQRLLHTMGYKWKKCNSNRKILVEKAKIVTSRCKYLNQIDQYRRDNSNIVYIDETWVDNTPCFNKRWKRKEEKGVLKNVSSSHQYIIAHAGGKEGFVKGAELIFKAHSTEGDYQGQMDASNFEKWINERLLPNIPPQSVIVMDNTPHHSVQINKPPSKYTKKTIMMEWLAQNQIPYSESMRRYELIELIDQNKSRDKLYKVDELIKSKGHSVLRLPAYMSDFNPIKLAWAKIKRTIREKNVSTLSASQLETLIKEAIEEVTPTDWAGFCGQVATIKQEHSQRNDIMEDVIEEMSNDFANGSSSNSSSSSSRSSSCSRSSSHSEDL